MLIWLLILAPLFPIKPHAPMEPDDPDGNMPPGFYEVEEGLSVVKPDKSPSNVENNMDIDWREVWAGQGPSNNRRSHKYPDDHPWFRRGL
jgi:hypothetical protein